MRQWRFLSAKFVIGTACLGLIIGIALIGGLIAPYAPNHQNLVDALIPPFAGGHILGTDYLGRDIFARMVSGARLSLLISMTVVIVSGAIGVGIGAMSGYWGGTRDLVIQKVVEAFWAFPPILLAIVVMALFGQSLFNLVLALALQRWIPYARLARANTLRLKNKDFVAAAMVMGGRTSWILRRHILPNLLNPSVVIATFSMATAITTEAGLSFLGLGAPPGTPTWGAMLAEGRSYMTSAWWLAVFPGVGIFLTVLGLNLLGDWLQDQLDSREDASVI